MRTTLDLKPQLVEKARELTGIEGKTELVHAGLQALIERAASRRLAALGGSMPSLRRIPRRRTKSR